MACGSGSGSNGVCDTFLTADMARKSALCPATIFSEIHPIQAAILDAIRLCLLEVTISDGTPMTSNNSVSSVTVNNGGTNYTSVNATSIVTHPSGVDAELTPVVYNGVITDFTIVNGGTGYNPIVVEADASATGDGNAVFEVVETSGVVTSVYVLVGGTGYSVGDVITIVHPTGADATAQVATIGTGGRILTTVVTSGGTGYNAINATLTIDHPTGQNFEGTLLVNSGSVVGVSITDGGYGYNQVDPQLSIDSVNGSGAVFSMVVSAGIIQSVDVVVPGSGYSSDDVITVIPVPGTGGAGADLSLEVTTVDNSVDTVYYYNVWNGIETDRTVKAQIDYLVSYFTCLGYNFKVQTNPATGNTLQWHISW